MTALLESRVGGLPRRAGKVRDVYEIGDDRLLIVATDRISAFDWVLPTGIPDKGRVLTGISSFWFERLGVPHHLIGPYETDDEALKGRAILARKARVVPFECVVRGYLDGSGWKEYLRSGTVCGERLPSGLSQGSRIGPIFTPATKAETGHDENVPFEVMASAVGPGLAAELRERSLDLYRRASDQAGSVGLILADTKFEWGHDVETGALLLIDEALTPDSSRYWPAEGHRPGGPQPSFDKQFVRDWLESTGWDKQSPPPELPPSVVEKTRAKYVDAFETLTGQPFAWK